MGLIKAGLGAINSTLKDQWKEFIYCDALDNDTLVVKGQKKTSKHSANHGNDNIISNGSGIVVADGQCMIILEQGRVVDICAEAGEYTYDISSEPSLFTNDLSDGIMETFKTIAARFAFGGDAGKDQRVYYFNIKELMNNKFGTANPIPFRVVDANIGLDIDVAVRCNGVYSYKIADPLLFYMNVCGNIDSVYHKSQLDQQLKSEFINALQPAMAKLSALGMRPNEIVGHVDELCKAMNEALSEKWIKNRGLEIVTIALNSLILPEEDAQMIKQAQKSAILRDPAMAAAQLAGAQADALRMAASNANGAMTGFMGMGMANANGANFQDLYAMGTTKNDKAQWQCSCGTTNDGNFCQNCGKPKPSGTNDWVCECGTVNDGNFCKNCGKARPNISWQCTCGTVNDGKFCKNCGKPRN